MLKPLKNKYPQHADKIDKLETIFDIIFIGLIAYVWFFGIAQYCDPNVLCAPCIELFENTFIGNPDLVGNLMNNVTPFIG